MNPLNYKGSDDLLNSLGYEVNMESDKKAMAIKIEIRRRSFFGRLVRLPKFIWKNWVATKTASLKDRISFTWAMVKIIMR